MRLKIQSLLKISRKWDERRRRKQVRLSRFKGLRGIIHCTALRSEELGTPHRKIATEEDEHVSMEEK